MKKLISKTFGRSKRLRKWILASVLIAIALLNVKIGLNFQASHFSNLDLDFFAGNAIAQGECSNCAGACISSNRTCKLEWWTCTPGGCSSGTITYANMKPY